MVEHLVSRQLVVFIQAVQLGLADGLGSAEYVAREIVKAEDMVDYTPQEGFAERVAKRFGAATAKSWLAPLSSGAINLR